MNHCKPEPDQMNLSLTCMSVGRSGLRLGLELLELDLSSSTTILCFFPAPVAPSSALASLVLTGLAELAGLAALALPRGAALRLGPICSQ